MIQIQQYFMDKFNHFEWDQLLTVESENQNRGFYVPKLGSYIHKNEEMKSRTKHSKSNDYCQWLQNLGFKIPKIEISGVLSGKRERKWAKLGEKTTEIRGYLFLFIFSLRDDRFVDRPLFISKSNQIKVQFNSKSFNLFLC